MNYENFSEVEKILSDEHKVNALLQKITMQVTLEQKR